MKNHNIYISNIDEAKLEGIRDFFRIQLDENVYPYVNKKEMMIYDRSNFIYREYTNINAEIKEIFNVYKSTSLSEIQKEKEINNIVQKLYDRLLELITIVSSEEKKTM